MRTRHLAALLGVLLTLGGCAAPGDSSFLPPPPLDDAPPLEMGDPSSDAGELGGDTPSESDAPLAGGASGEASGTSLAIGTSLVTQMGVVWRHDSGTVIEWEQLGTSTVGALTRPPVADPDWVLGGVGDFDADGIEDYLWRHRTAGVNGIWHLTANGDLRDVVMLPTVPADWRIGGVGYFNRDGYADVAWHHRDGAVVLWLTERGSVASGITLSHVPAPFELAGVGDLDGDGISDILWRNPGTPGQTVAVWYLGSDARSVRAGYFLPIDVDAGWKLVGVSDVNNDRRGEIVWWNQHSGQMVYWSLQESTLVDSAAGDTVHPSSGWRPLGVRARGLSTFQSTPGAEYEGASLELRRHGTTLATVAAVYGAGRRLVATIATSVDLADPAAPRLLDVSIRDTLGRSLADRETAHSVGRYLARLASERSADSRYSIQRGEGIPDTCSNEDFFKSGLYYLLSGIGCAATVASILANPYVGAAVTLVLAGASAGGLALDCGGLWYNTCGMDAALVRFKCCLGLPTPPPFPGCAADYPTDATSCQCAPGLTRVVTPTSTQRGREGGEYTAQCQSSIPCRSLPGLPAEGTVCSLAANEDLYLIGNRESVGPGASSGAWASTIVRSNPHGDVRVVFGASAETASCDYHFQCGGNWRTTRARHSSIAIRNARGEVVDGRLLMTWRGDRNRFGSPEAPCQSFTEIFQPTGLLVVPRDAGVGHRTFHSVMADTPGGILYRPPGWDECVPDPIP